MQLSHMSVLEKPVAMFFNNCILAGFLFVTWDPGIA